MEHASYKQIKGEIYTDEKATKSPQDKLLIINPKIVDNQLFLTGIDDAIMATVFSIFLNSSGSLL